MTDRIEELLEQIIYCDFRTEVGVDKARAMIRRAFFKHGMEIRKTSPQTHHKEHQIEFAGDSKSLVDPDECVVGEDHPNFEAFIRAFWRRIEPFKNDYGKELPADLPLEFRASMATAFVTFSLKKQR